MKEIAVPMLAPAPEGKELDMTVVAVPSRGQSSSGYRGNQRPGTTEAGTSPPPSSTPKRSALLMTSASLSTKELDEQADQILLGAIERTNSRHNHQDSRSSMSSSSSFGKSYLSSMIGGLSLSLSRSNTRDSVNGTAPVEEEDPEITEKEKEKDRGRALFKSAKRTKSASQAAVEEDTGTPATSRDRSRARSQSPFFFRRNRQREPSPTIPSLPLPQSETDLSDASSSVHPRNAFTDSLDSGDETVGEPEYYSDEEDDDDDDVLDPVTERNTEHNAIVSPVAPPDAANAIDEAEPDPLGEGVNVVVPPEPYFESTLNSGGSTTRSRRNPRRRKSVKHHDPLPHHTSRPVFQRDRATITVTQGDPAGKIGERKKRMYVVASDLSEESRYAVEWGIGTVLRDGDEMLVVTVVENESKGVALYIWLGLLSASHLASS
jgi:hypothetical protein